VVVEICRTLALKVREKNITADELKRVDGVFVSLSSFGIVEAESLDGELCNQSPLCGGISRQYLELLRRESA
jgi:branched-subunit amino acid aminotransferase/4-amino-4-deoxychorismate lyase